MAQCALAFAGRLDRLVGVPQSEQCHHEGVVTLETHSDQNDIWNLNEIPLGI